MLFLFDSSGTLHFEQIIGALSFGIHLKTPPLFEDGDSRRL